MPTPNPYTRVRGWSSRASGHKSLAVLCLAALIAMAMLAALAGCSVSGAPATWTKPAQVETVRIVVLGDSNSASSTVGTPVKWPEVMRERLAAAHPSTHYVLVNSATPGWTSRHVLDQLSANCLSLHPDIVCLMVGTNDVLGGDNRTRACSSAETSANLRTIIEQVRTTASSDTRSGHPLLMLMQPPPACSKTVFRSKRTTYPYYRAQSSAESTSNSLLGVKTLVSDLAHEYGLPLVATYDRTAALGYDGTQPGTSILILDGLHASETEQNNIAAWVGEAVTPKLSSSGAP